MKKQNIATLILCISAALLSALLIGSYTARDAYADASVKSSDFILGVVSVRDTQDMITVIDVPAQKMLIYVPDKPTSPTRLDMGTGVDLKGRFGDNKGRE